MSRMSNLKEIEEWQGWGALGVSGRPRRKGLESTIPYLGAPPHRNPGGKELGCLSARSALGGARVFLAGRVRKGLQTTIPDLGGLLHLGSQEVWVVSKTEWLKGSRVSSA